MRGDTADGGRAWAVAARMEPGRLVFAGRLGAAHAHAHAAVQVLLVASGRVLLTDAGGRSLAVRAAVIPAGAEHTLHADDATGVMVYLDPAGRAARALTARLEHTVRTASAPQAAVRQSTAPQDTTRQSPASQAAVRQLAGPQAAVRHAAGPQAAVRQVAVWRAAALPAAGMPAVADRAGMEAGERAVALLAGPAAGAAPVVPAPGSALHRALEVLAERAATGEPIRLAAVASDAGLSADRLRHLFTERMGLPFTACVRWARLQAAMAVVRDGGTLTAAAHAAGFTDSAHLTRVFHAMFGLAPSAAARHLHWC
ncbi:helix-turn-helix transcriptional regulator [Actinocorallia libanotica]|uniref:AraC family transcriptional regulator n=1 Tax=Actinocorallia libanotica TaxID=46162 RepID=A0ABN1Q3S1_9ACTN